MPITPVPGTCLCSFVTPGDEMAPIVQSVQHVDVGTFAVTAAADAATDGFAWLLNPIGSGVVLDVRKVWFISGPGTVPLVLTAPTEVTVERVTFTGTAVGASVTPMPRDTAQAAAVGTVRTASTGLVLAAGPKGHSFTVQQVLGDLALAVTTATPTDQMWPAETDTNDHVVLRPGEGIVFRQNTAGAAALEDRTIQIDLTWDERVP